jgi:hypothetical protein
LFLGVLTLCKTSGFGNLEWGDGIDPPLSEQTQLTLGVFSTLGGEAAHILTAASRVSGLSDLPPMHPAATPI